MKIGAGVAPVPAMIEAGVAVGIGTDGAGSNNDLNLWARGGHGGQAAQAREWRPDRAARPPGHRDGDHRGVHAP